MMIEEGLVCSFKILKPITKSKGFGANRPMTPPKKRKDGKI